MMRDHYEGRLGDGDQARDAEKHHVPWEQKIAKAFWRGKLTGPARLVGPAQLPAVSRVIALRISREHPDLFDFKFTDYERTVGRTFPKAAEAGPLVEWDNATFAAVKEIYDSAKGDPVDFDVELPKYKYILNVAGVVSAWRLTQILRSGSLLLIQKQHNWELPFDWLEEWVHYVPVSKDLTDLAYVVQYLQAHDSLARDIAAQGYKRFLEHVTSSAMYCNLWHSVRSLGQLFKPVAAAEVGSYLSASEKPLKLRHYQRVMLEGSDYVPLPDRLRGMKVAQPPPKVVPQVPVAAKRIERAARKGPNPPAKKKRRRKQVDEDEEDEDEDDDDGGRRKQRKKRRQEL